MKKTLLVLTFITSTFVLPMAYNKYQNDLQAIQNKIENAQSISAAKSSLESFLESETISEEAKEEIKAIIAQIENNASLGEIKEYLQDKIEATEPKEDNNDLANALQNLADALKAN